MADQTHIEWTDATWNIITGCSVVSPGCTNCYAMRLAGTRLRHHPSRQGLTIDTKAGPVWNGQVRFNEQWLDQPARWTKPRRIFVCAHGDLFHPDVPFGWVMRILMVIAMTPHHTYQVLTKRPDRAREFFRRWANVDEENDWGFRNARGPEEVRAAHPSGRGQLFADMLEAMGQPPPGCAYPAFDWANGMSRWEDVFPNLWLGVSVEDQCRADERIPILLDTPAAVRWISAEPLLGPIDLEAAWHGENALDSECWGDCAWCEKGHRPLHNCQRGKQSEADSVRGRSGLDWVVVGGESGPGARPMHPDWVRQIRDQCAAADVQFLFKQWGAWSPVETWRPGRATQRAIMLDGSPVADDAVPQDVGGQRFVLDGKRAAGRKLDGRLHDGFPE
ncbi:hypothetical protein KOAAANKH_00138 [Brevundimonas sp. NIBR10]|uniref:phage Gp37/Gp68 family protein n=1 Tax=Brevundimonas sp. NIBR10 TaxID=3015997 RepID=UPI0022F18689|nr:phage Gp37/Gp68 family protein [Brevundimonas sp. NIBR10]WGM45277.1 hypothetical protein KOAAANKH_00138 [Brevundimonas sp. NIBR10]